MTRGEADEGEKHAVAGAVYTLRPEYGRHVPCLLCACAKAFWARTWEEAGEEYDEHLAGEDTP